MERQLSVGRGTRPPETDLGPRSKPSHRLRDQVLPMLNGGALTMIIALRQPA